LQVALSGDIDHSSRQHRRIRLQLPIAFLHLPVRELVIFGWLKTVGGQRKTRYRGEELVGWMFELGGLQSGPDEKTRCGSRLSWEECLCWPTKGRGKQQMTNESLTNWPVKLIPDR